MADRIQSEGNRAYDDVIEFASTQASPSFGKYDSLVVLGPGGGRFQLRNIPVSATAAQVGFAVLERYYDPITLNLKRDEIMGSLRLVPETVKGRVLSADEQQDRALSAEETLRDADVNDGDWLVLVLLPGAAPSWLEVGKFLEAAAASGVTGSLAYDLLKSTITSTVSRWQRKKHLETIDPTLNRGEAVSIAQACACLYLGIEDPQKLIVSSAQCNASGLQWTVSLRSHGLKNLSNMEVRVNVPSPNPKDAQILIVPSL